MKITKTTCICDLCKVEADPSFCWTTEISIAPTVEEGRPYILAPALRPGEMGFTGPIKVDLCQACLEKIIGPILEMDRKMRRQSLAY